MKHVKNISVMLVVLGLTFVWGCFMGDYYAPKNWCNGYTDGYCDCEVDFWYEQNAVLEKHKNKFPKKGPYNVKNETCVVKK